MHSSYIEALIKYMEMYRCTKEEAERLLDDDLSVTGLTPEEILEDLESNDGDTFNVSSDDLREWQLANVGLTEADVPYECRHV